MTTLTKTRPRNKQVLDMPRKLKKSAVTTGFSANGHTESVPFTLVVSPEEADPFYYGWRYERVELPDGTIRVDTIPLPAERFLNPQMGDFFVQGDKHYSLADSIHDSYENRYDNDENVTVFSDLKMIWGIPGLDQPAPDVSIVPNVKNLGKHRRSFKVLEEGTRPTLVVEVTSPRYPFDEAKIPTYEQAGVEEYIIVDPHWGDAKNELEFSGYRMVQGSYQPMVKDDQGRLYSHATDTYLYFEPGEVDEVTSYITDGTTGERMLDSKGSHRARLAEIKERQAAEERARQATEQAEAEASERRLAEERAKEAAKQVEAEASERRLAEERVEAEVAERRAAEERANEALAKIAQLEALLAQQQQ